MTADRIRKTGVIRARCDQSLKDRVLALAARVAGASGTGRAKARSSATARAAAAKRWANYRRKHGIPNPPNL